MTVNKSIFTSNTANGSYAGDAIYNFRYFDCEFLSNCRKHSPGYIF